NHFAVRRRRCDGYRYVFLADSRKKNWPKRTSLDHDRSKSNAIFWHGPPCQTDAHRFRYNRVIRLSAFGTYYLRYFPTTREAYFHGFFATISAVSNGGF